MLEAKALDVLGESRMKQVGFGDSSPLFVELKFAVYLQIEGQLFHCGDGLSTLAGCLQPSGSSGTHGACVQRLAVGDKVGGSSRFSLVSSELSKTRTHSLGVVRARDRMKLWTASSVDAFTSLLTQPDFSPLPALTQSQHIQDGSRLPRHS